MYLIDSNILIYAINEDSEYHSHSRKIIDLVNNGEIQACISLQNILETFAVMTDSRRIENPLPPNEAMQIIKDDYIDNPMMVKIAPKLTVVDRILDLFDKYDLKLTILGLILLQLSFPVAIVIPTPAFAGVNSSGNPEK